MKKIYNTIIEKLTSDEAKLAYQAANVPTCKFIDLFRGQYFVFEDFDVFPCPAVLVELQIIHNAGKSTINVTLHLCYEQLQDTSSISRSKDNALKFFDYAETTKLLLEDLESDTTGKLELINEETIKDDAIVNVYQLSYTGSYEKTLPQKFIYTEEDSELITNKGRIRDFGLMS